MSRGNPTSSKTTPFAVSKVRQSTLVAIFVILGAALAAYYNSFSSPFVFDDISAIVENPTIRDFRTAFFPPTQTFLTVSGRPLLNASFALNYRFGGLGVRGYHAVNLALHCCAGLVLFGIIRRTLRHFPSFGGSAVNVAALSVAVLWIVHPLQTESVTYVVQRAESLMAVFYLLTLYTFIRAADSRRPLPWYLLSVFCCLLGMASKEVMLSAPLVILLYDRAFISPSIREAFRRRGLFYPGLAFTWFLLVILIHDTGDRGGTAGFGTAVNWWSYALTQCHAVVMYLKLSFWPFPLVFDYGESLVTDLPAVLPQALFLTVLLAGSFVAFISDRWRWVGFLGVWFFGILAPTSSVVPVVTQTMAEHRMYLPLAAVIALGVVGLHRLLGRRAWIGSVALAVLCVGFTLRRNEDYFTDLRIWQDTAVKRPDNPRAQYGLGTAFLTHDRSQEAIEPLEAAIRLKPDLPNACVNLATALSNVGRVSEAIGYYEQALRLSPADPEAHNNLGTMYFSAGQMSEAIRHYAQALSRRPNYPEAHYNLGLAYANTGRLQEAVVEFQAALAGDPSLVAAWCRLGYTLEQYGRPAEAAASFAEAFRRDPGSTEAREGLARLRANSLR